MDSRNLACLSSYMYFSLDLKLGHFKKVPEIRHPSSNLSKICTFCWQMLKIINKKVSNLQKIIGQNKKYKCSRLTHIIICIMQRIS